MNGGYQGREGWNCSMAMYNLVIQVSKSWVWWPMPVILSPRRLRQKDHKFRGSLGYKMIYPIWKEKGLSSRTLQLQVNYCVLLRILLGINFMSIVLNTHTHTQRATRKLGGDVFHLERGDGEMSVCIHLNSPNYANYVLFCMPLNITIKLSYVGSHGTWQGVENICNPV